MSDRRVLVIHSDKEDFTGREINWRGHRFRFSPFGYEDFVVHTGKSETEFEIYQSIVDRVNDLIDKEADIVWSESPEALVVSHIRSLQGRRHVPFVIHEQDRLIRVRRVAEWIRDREGSDPLPGFLSNTRHCWMHMTKSQRDFYIENGIPAERLFYFACSTAELRFVAPTVFDALKREPDPAERLPEIAAKVKGKPLAAGSNLRDYDTLAAAAELLDFQVHVLCDLKRYPPRGPKNLVWHDFVPVGDYIHALRAASMAIVSLKDTDISGGENSTTFAWSLGKPVIATRVEATVDFATDGHDAILVPPNDPAALAEAIRKLKSNPKLAAAVGENGRTTEAGLSAVCESNLAKAFDIAFNS